MKDGRETIKEYDHLLATQGADSFQYFRGKHIVMDVRKVGLYFFRTTPLVRAKQASA